MRIFALAIACLLLNQFIFAQTYYPFPTDSATWSVEEYFHGNFPYTSDECIALHYGMVGDTAIGNLTYSKLYGNNLPADYPYEDTAFNYPTATYVAAVREDSSRKVWVRKAGDTLDILYYDFALDSGDTFCFDYFGTGCWPVVLVDSVLIGGNYRRRIHFQASNPEVWIEGIGSTTGWFAWQYIGSFSWQLLCYTENQNQLYSISNDCHCDTYTGVGINEGPDEVQLKLYPNPTSGRFSLDFEQPVVEALDLKIFSIQGKLIHAAKINDQFNDISLPEIADGMYFVTVEDGHGHRWTRRLSKASE